MQQGHLKAQPGQEDFLPRWLPLKLLAGGRVPCHVALSGGSVLTAQQLVFQSEWSKRDKYRNVSVFYDVALEVTLFHFLSVSFWWHESALFQMGGGYTGCENQEVGITCSHVGGWFPHPAQVLFLPFNLVVNSYLIIYSSLNLLVLSLWMVTWDCWIPPWLVLWLGGLDSNT